MNSLRSLLLGVVIASLAGCGAAPDNPLLLPADNSPQSDTSGLTLVVRIVQISDTHVVDTESPARFAGAYEIVPTAWRSWEAYSTQLLDGIVRITNRIHASGKPIDFVMFTGDACDNSQFNELGWFLGIMDGRSVNPLSGPDDRAGDARPTPAMDPYAGFQAQGLYRAGVHGDLPSIPWYGLIGNHDAYAIGVFPIITSSGGDRTAPLPLSFRPGVLLPSIFDPIGCWAHGNVTPANPGPPELFTFPTYVTPNSERAYFDKHEFMQALFGTATGPAGHGFQNGGNGPTWYSLSPAPGLRLIGLDTSDQPLPIPGFPYSEGCIAETQRQFLRDELDAAQARGEIVVVATHHPSRTLDVLYGSALAPADFRDLLNAYPNVVLHLAGHNHWNRVAQRGGYVEIETCSTLDPPQEGRIVEIWRDAADGAIVIGYRMFSDTDDSLPSLGDDPLRALRGQARAIVGKNGVIVSQERRLAGPDADPEGSPSDRAGVIRLGR